MAVKNTDNDYQKRVQEWFVLGKKSDPLPTNQPIVEEKPLPIEPKEGKIAPTEAPEEGFFQKAKGWFTGGGKE